MHNNHTLGTPFLPAPWRALPGRVGYQSIKPRLRGDDVEKAARQRVSAAERREIILIAAKKLFAAKSLHGVSIDEIAAASSVSPAMIYHHFPSKDALYDEILEWMSCKRESYIQAIIHASTEFSDVLGLLTQTYVESVAKDPDYLRMEILSIMEKNKASSQFFENRWRPLIEYIEMELPELAHDRGLPTPDVRAVTLMFQGMVREALYQKLICNEARWQKEDLGDLVERMITIFLAAVGLLDHAPTSRPSGP